MSAFRPFKRLLALTAVLAVGAVCLAALLTAKTTRKLVVDAGLAGFVGPVPVADLARAVAGGDLPPPTEAGEKAAPHAFYLVVTTVRMPHEPARVKCEWQHRAVGAGDSDSREKRSLGRFQSYKVVALDDESREIGTWKPSTKVTVWSATSAGTVMDRPPTFEPFEVHTDWRPVGELVHVINGLVVVLESTADVIEAEANGTYHVAFLCQEGDEAAFLAETHGEAGHGLLCVLREDAGRWKPVGCEETWVT